VSQARLVRSRRTGTSLSRPVQSSPPVQLGGGMARSLTPAASDADEPWLDTLAAPAHGGTGCSEIDRSHGNISLSMDFAREPPHNRPSCARVCPVPGAIFTRRTARFGGAPAGATTPDIARCALLP
jgi:hypothetical protein